MSNPENTLPVPPKLRSRDLLVAFIRAPALSWLLGVLLVSIGLAHLARKYLEWSDVAAVGIGMAIAAIFFLTDVGQRHAGRWGWVALWSMPPIILFGVWHFFVTVFGEFNIWSVLFHAQMGIETPDIIWQYLRDSLPTLAGIALIIAGLGLLARRDQRIRKYDRWAALALLAINPIFFQFAFVAQASIGSDDRLLSLYKDSGTVPPLEGNRRNYIHIFLESAERTYFDKQFQDVMAPLAPFEARGLSALDLQQTALTGWSAAGITAANCGVPLFSKGFLRTRYLKFVPSFLPGATCVGDLLERDGYALSYIMGAEMRFAGIGNLFTTHGYGLLIDGNELHRRYEGGKSAWGPDDEIVFLGALDEVRRLWASGQPFGVTLDTAGGHAPDGHLSRSCKSDESVMQLSPAILRGVKCTNMLAARFLEALETEGLLRNTVVFVQSDHLAMKNPLTSALDALPRRNLLFAFGPGISPLRTSKPASPSDVMPTILEALGYELPEGKAGLGVSLFSSRPSLVSTLGKEAFDGLVLGDGVLGARLWQEASTAAATGAPTQ